MRKSARKESQDRSVDLLEKLLIMTMHSMGATQDQIAKTVGRQKLWVNGVLKGLPKERR